MGTLNTQELPFSPRKLNKKELTTLDIYSYISPKAGRLVRVVGPIRLGYALLLEFDPAVVAYVERPRLIQSTQGLYEVDYWFTKRSGQESMVLLVEARAERVDSAGRRQHRAAEALLIAAEKANLPLSFVHEHELLTHQHSMCSALRLLPSVQIAGQLLNAYELRREILKLFEQFDVMRVEHVISAVPCGFAGDVRCVIAELLHRGELALVDSATVHQMSRLRRVTS